MFLLFWQVLIVSEPMDVDEGPVRSQTVFVIHDDDDDDDVIQITASGSEEVIAVRSIPNPTNGQRRPITFAERMRQLRQRVLPNSRQQRNELRQPDGGATTSSGGGSGSGTSYAGAGSLRTVSERARRRNEASSSSSLRHPSLNSFVQNPIPAGAEVYLVGGTLYREIMSRAEPDVINLDDD